jgi:hypothetical protein
MAMKSKSSTRKTAPKKGKVRKTVAARKKVTVKKASTAKRKKKTTR